MKGESRYRAFVLPAVKGEEKKTKALLLAFKRGLGNPTLVRGDGWIASIQRARGHSAQTQ